MSYDVLIIDPATVPTNTHTEFMAWFDEASEWEQDRDYGSTAESSAAIVACYKDITAHFPDMNGEALIDDDFDDPQLSDYTIGDDFLYVAFRWSVEDAPEKSLAAAHHNGLALVDISGDSTIYFADGRTLTAKA